MTVVAYRWSTLAADTMGTDDGTIVGHVHKVGKTADGWLWGVTGRRSWAGGFIAWAERREGDPPSFSDAHSDHILVSPDGVVKWWTGEGWIEPLPQEFHAWGCGRELAIGAMAMGADALGAVRVACNFDTSCNGGPESVSLTPDTELPATIHPVVSAPEFAEVGDDDEPEEAWGFGPISPVDAPSGRDPTSADWRKRWGLI